MIELSNYSYVVIGVLFMNLLFLRFVLFHLRKNKALKYYASAVLMTLFWQGLDFSMATVRMEAQTAIWLWKIADIFSMVLVVFLFLFIVEIQKRTKLKKLKILLLLLSILNIFIIIFSNNYIFGIEETVYYLSADIGGPLKLIQNSFILILLVSLIFLTGARLFKSRGKGKFELVQNTLLFIATLFSVVPAIITEIILPRLGFSIFPMGGLSTTVFMAILLISIYRFQFLDIRPRRFSIASKLLFIFIIISLGVASVITSLLYIESKKAVEERIFSQLESVVTIKEQQIKHLLEEEAMEIEEISLVDDFANHILLYHQDEDSRASSSIEVLHQQDIKRINNNLLELLSKTDFIEIFFLNNEGKIYMSSEQSQIGKIKKDNPYFIEGSKSTYTSNIYYSVTRREPAMTVSTPITHEDEVLGVLVGRIDLSTINDIMLERSGLGESGETYLINNLNYFLTDSRFIPDSALKQRAFSPGINKCLVGDSVLAKDKDYRQYDVFGMYKWLPVLEMCLVAEIDEEEAMSIISDATKRLSILGIIFLLLLFLLSLITAKLFTSPIKNLVRAAKEVAQGNLNVESKIKSRDEIGDLSQIFNDMVANLKSSREEIKKYSTELEKEVEAKTIELRNMLKEEKTAKTELDKQRMATLNILEDVSESEETLKNLNDQLEKKSHELTALKLISDEFTSVLDAEEVIMIANKYIKEFFEYNTLTFVVVNPSEEGRLIYNSFIIKEVGEKYINEVKKDFYKQLKKFEKNPEMNSALKIMQTVEPKYFGKKLNNSLNKNPGDIEYFPLQIGDKILGLVQITAESGEKVLDKEKRELFNAIITAVTLSIDRLQTLILTQHSKTVSLVESLSDGVIMFNNNADLVLMNPSFVHYTGLSKEYFSMKDLYKLITDHDIKSMVQDALKKGQSSHINEVKLVNHFFEIFITPVRDSQKQIVGGAIIFHDITYLKEIDQMKTEFVSVASHQLRTPLTAIKLFTDMLVENEVGETNKEQAEYLDNIRQSTERMVRLVNDLLNVTRIESGRLKIEPQPLDIVLFLKNIIAEAKPIASTDKKVIEFTDKAKKLPLIPIDQNLMRQVFHNLIINAIRYSPNNTGKVDVVLSKEDKDNIMIRVKDNGIGIPVKKQSRIFEKFYRADNAIKAVTEGTGLGLYVSKMIVELAGGKIWFESKEGKGTIFFVSLPIKGMEAKEGERGLAIS